MDLCFFFIGMCVCNLCAFYFFFYNLYFLILQFSFNLLYVISDRPDILYAFLLRFSDSISREKTGRGKGVCMVFAWLKDCCSTTLI